MPKSSNSKSKLSHGHKEALNQVERFRMLVDSVQDYAIFLLDEHGNVLSWNTGAQKIKGYKPEEIIGKNFSTFYQKKDIAAGKPEKELADASKYGHVEDEGWRLKKDGSRFWANVIVSALYDEGGKLIGFSKVTRDMTDRKKIETDLRGMNRTLRKQQIELEKLNNIKDEFVSLASHQLRTPATGVKQFLGLILQGYAGDLTDLQKDYLQKAYDSNNRQIAMVNDLLHVAQVDAGKVILEKTRVDLNEMVKDIIDEYVDSFKERKQRVSIEVEPGLPHALVDKMRFRMVLENLIDNASKYTPERGEIVISLRTDMGRFEIEIKDTGVGIKAAYMPELFDKFSRIPNKLSDKVGGSGLGLYWASKIVQLHSGKIRVKSKPDKGSTFTVSIPLGDSYA